MTKADTDTMRKPLRVELLSERNVAHGFRSCKRS